MQERGGGKSQGENEEKGRKCKILVKFTKQMFFCTVHRNRGDGCG